jgi:hypothetical protein
MKEDTKGIEALSFPARLGEAKTTRRAFFTTAFVLAGAAALTGCGGGGDSVIRRSSGTYRNFGSGNQATVSVSIDNDGLLTFFVLFSNDDVADYGQSYIDDDGFFTQTFGGFRTFGNVRSGRIEGRTEEDDTPSNGFDWIADRYTPSAFLRPGNNLIGTFDGFQRRNGIDYTTFLTVAPDGTATIFSELDLPGTTGIDQLLFEGASFDRNGNVPNNGEYFLDLFDDRFSLSALSNDEVRLRITFGSSIPSVDIDPGDVVDLILQQVSPNDVRTRRATTVGERVINPAARERIFKALREGRKVEN